MSEFQPPATAEDVLGPAGFDYTAYCESLDFEAEDALLESYVESQPGYQPPLTPEEEEVLLLAEADLRLSQQDVIHAASAYRHAESRRQIAEANKHILYGQVTLGNIVE